MTKTLKKDDIIEAISGLTVLELADLVKNLEEKFGVSASMPMAMAAAAPQGAGEAQAEVKTTFDLELTEVGANKIQAIKVLREVTSLGLKEAKDLVEAAPKVFKEGASKEEAENIKNKFNEVGAKITLK
ncbi:MAG: 50S ribosomal protein L7/L12 [Armatimonadetes bacterium]|nr:50S ribosomal protein L7/L12 [Armatimonadota bacterium]